MRSRAKGAGGEREAAKEWARVVGTQARRGQQFSGGADSPDIVHGLGDTIHIEVKRTERGNPYVWLAQAVRDAGGKIPLVLHRRNNQPWLVIVRLDDVTGLAAKIAAEAEGVGGRAFPRVVSGAGVSQAEEQDG